MAQPTVKTTEETKNRWEELSDTYDRVLSKSVIPSGKSLIDHLDLNQPNLVVVDAGCGPCQLTPYLISQSQPDLQLYLCDYTPKMVEFAKVF